MRWVLSALAAILAYLSITFSLAQSIKSFNPALAHRLAPYEGRITAYLASSLIEGDANQADRARADRLAHIALRQEPIGVIAISTLGANAEARGDTSTARRFYAYTFVLSRRDLKTQLWEIENAVARGDVASALRYYDIALRTRPALSNLLYPILASASSDPAIRRALVRTLAAKPRWGNSFIDYVASRSSDPTLVAQLFVDLQRARVAIPAKVQTSVVNALVNTRQFDDAWHYYSSIHPGAALARSRDPRFIGFEYPSLLDWVTVNDGGIVTSIQGGLFNFIVPASVGGPLLQQVQLLPPGPYRIAGQSSGIDDEESARPYWSLRCRGNDREIGRVVLPNSAQSNGRFAGTFSIPAGCPMQTLALMARPSAAVTGIAGSIEQVMLEPAR